MVLVFFILFIFIIISLFFVILILSTIKIEINNLKIGNKEIDNKVRIKDKYQIKISLKFLEKISVFCIVLDDKKIRKINNKMKSKNINFGKMQGKMPSIKEGLEIVKNIKIKLSKMNLIANIGTENSILTSYLVAITASLVGIVLPYLSKENIENCKYIINPKYQNKNEYQISFDCIIQIKIVHIIYTIFNFIKKGRDENERTSNRRSYAYRYE